MSFLPTDAAATEYVRPIQTIKIAKSADLAQIFGDKLAKAILATGNKKNGNCRTRPRSVELYTRKPAFYLGDGDVLDFYGMDVVNQKLLGHHYAGSGDSAINNPEAQLSEGNEIPQDGMVAIRYWWDGQKMSWTVYAISSRFTPQLKAAE